MDEIRIAIPDFEEDISAAAEDAADGGDRLGVIGDAGIGRKDRQGGEIGGGNVAGFQGFANGANGERHGGGSTGCDLSLTAAPHADNPTGAQPAAPGSSTPAGSAKIAGTPPV
jgi:hypothetical protein